MCWSRIWSARGRRSARTHSRASVTRNQRIHRRLQGDAIQPLTLRVNAGECLRVQLRNAIEGEPASLHLHGSALYVASAGGPAIAANPRAMAGSGETVVYE